MAIVASPSKSLPSDLRTFVAVIISIPAAIDRTVVITSIVALIHLILLLEDHPVELYVGVVHNKIFRHKSFKLITINHIKSTMLSQTFHQI